MLEDEVCLSFPIRVQLAVILGSISLKLVVLTINCQKWAFKASVSLEEAFFLRSPRFASSYICDARKFNTLNLCTIVQMATAL